MKKTILGFLAGAVFSSVLMISLPVAAGKATIQDVFDKVKATKTSVGNVGDRADTIHSNLLTHDDNLSVHDNNMTDYLFYIDTNAYYACLGSDYWENCLDILASSSSINEDAKAEIRTMREETGAAQRIQEIIESK